MSCTFFSEKRRASNNGEDYRLNHTLPRQRKKQREDCSFSSFFFCWERMWLHVSYYRLRLPSYLSGWLLKKINIHKHNGLNGNPWNFEDKGGYLDNNSNGRRIRLELWWNKVFWALDINLALKYSSGFYKLNKLGKRSKICYSLLTPFIIFG